YNPSTDSWTATSTTNAPTARGSHTAVWTGSEIIVWGGVDQDNNLFNTGGRYNPSTDGCPATSATNAPTARSVHMAVWTGREMIGWGGRFGVSLGTGLRSGEGTIQGPTVGQLPAAPTRPFAESITRQSGPAMK